MKKLVNTAILSFAGAFLTMLLLSCAKQSGIVSNGSLKIEVNNELQTCISTDSASIPIMTGFQPSEYLISNGDTINSFRLQSTSTQKLSDLAGEGSSKIFTGTSDYKDMKLTKVLTINTYKGFRDWAFYKVQYINTGNKNVNITKWVNHAYDIESNHDIPAFWSFQASSTGARKSWIVPVEAGFSQKNYLGMNDPDYGGGIPVLDIWRKDAGIAIGHTDLKPQLVSLPVKMDKAAHVSVGYEYPVAVTLHPGDTLNTLETFVTIHHGDNFTTLQQYAAYMAKKGIVMPQSEPLAFEPMWCAWGYERKFTVNEILGTLPKVKELGFKWVTLDDGYQQAEGDWHTNKDRFPDGDADMKKLVNIIHSYGFNAQIWWAPLAVDPGSKLLSAQPDLISKNADGSPQKISWWDSYYMSPAYPPVLEHTQSTVDLFIKEWGFDGLKLDGQHLNACPPDYNPVHKLYNPNAAPESVPAFFKLIFETAHRIKPAAVIQLCPCGDAMSFYNMPYTNQFVGSDPVGSTQIRSKGKTYKALAPQTAYFGDHVELSDNKDDFASTIGIGAVPGTKFTWPKDNPFVTEGHFVLTPEKEKEWKKWIDIYKAHMLSKGEYLGGLYDIGYNLPETHVIRKSDTLFYAFYAKNWQGTLNLKGLSAKAYKVIDYVNNRDFGRIVKEKPKLETSFEKYLLLMAYPD